MFSVQEKARALAFLMQIKNNVFSLNIEHQSENGWLGPGSKKSSAALDRGEWLGQANPREPRPDG